MTFIYNWHAFTNSFALILLQIPIDHNTSLGQLLAHVLFSSSVVSFVLLWPKDINKLPSKGKRV